MVDYSKWDKFEEELEEETFIGSKKKPSDVAPTMKNFSPLIQALQPLAALPQLVRGANIVSIGEASHGTHEFYHFRAELTKRLIKDKQLNAILIETDFPDTARLHRYVMGYKETTVNDALNGFKRFPQWMWRNGVFRCFLEWLKTHNLTLPPVERVGIFGLDVYSLHASMEAIIGYLTKENADQDTINSIKSLYSCFDRFGHEPQQYGFETQRNLKDNCCREAKWALELLANRTKSYSRDIEYADNNLRSSDEEFINEHNARVVVSAESYYRAMFDPLVSSWDIRDTHFFNTMECVREHLLKTRGTNMNKVVLWAHNSHLGNAAETESRGVKELNVGQLIKEKYPNDSVSIGQFTYAGTVTAADNWDGMHQKKTVTRGLHNSYEDLFHTLSIKSGKPAYVLNFHNPDIALALTERPRLQRAIGVIYRPDTERQSHYFYANIVKQFDFMTWFDYTRAVRPLDNTEEHAEEPETYPSGL